MQADGGWVEQVGGISFVPVLHGRAEFARPVREALRELSPSSVAIELPRGLESIYRDGVARFPALSYLTSATLEEDAGEGGAPLWRIEPTDPFCEGIRTAGELGLRVDFIDIYRSGYPLHRDRLPDPYAALSMGVKSYYRSCLEAFPRGDENLSHTVEHPDVAREMIMASRLLQLARSGPVVALLGLKHIEAVAQWVRRAEDLPPVEELIAGERLPRLQLYHPSLRTVRTLSEELPFLMAAYELQRGGPGADQFWQAPQTLADLEAEQERSESQAKPSELEKGSVFRSLEKLLGFQVKPESIDLTNEQLKNLNAYLSSLKPETWTPASLTSQTPSSEPPEIGGTAAPAAEGRAPRYFTFKSSEERRPELRDLYREVNASARTAQTLELDRQLVIKDLFLAAARFYTENTGEEVKLWQHQNFNRFSRRYAHLAGRLLPTPLQLFMAARACIDHNFAYEFWDLGTFYPWQKQPEDGVQSFDFDGDSLSIDGLKLQHFEFHRTFPRLRQALQRVPVPERNTPTDDPTDWAGAFESGRICSYPPEDIVIEDYGRYLQKKAVKVQSEVHSRTEPFTTSLLDGIDMRTTLRNWADGQKLYVREEKKVLGGTGSVVLIFDEDLENSRYPWCITWHGEHDQESDMAFYSTDRRQKIIGPGIARCEYGGLMLSYPPRRLGNVWGDPYYREARTKAELLLFAAIDYCVDRHIIYVAAQTPRSFYFRLAERMGKKLVYLPIGSLSPTALERIRVFHVLAGHRYRELAKDFIW